MAEAFYQNVPLVVISADRPAAWIGQMDGQTLPQPGYSMCFEKRNQLEYVFLVCIHSAVISCKVIYYEVIGCGSCREEGTIIRLMVCNLNGGKPAAVCCTSGTALLNLHPAVAEAFYQNVPLVVRGGQQSATGIESELFFFDVHTTKIDV